MARPNVKSRRAFLHKAQDDQSNVCSREDGDPRGAQGRKWMAVANGEDQLAGHPR
jgi:hypothetical protein